MPATPQVGELAPDFTLPGTAPGDADRDYTLSAERGHPVVLAFYPGDETPVCTRQLCSYQHDLDAVRELDTTLWGISGQNIESHRKFQANRGLSFPLLADVDSTAFGAFGLGSVLNRGALCATAAAGRVAGRPVPPPGLPNKNPPRTPAVVGVLAPPSPPYPTDLSQRRTQRPRSRKPSA